MRRFLTAALLVGALTAVPTMAALAGGSSPAQLAKAGWDCFQPPPDFNPYIHCSPPGQLAGIISGTARSAMFIAFATTDLHATEADMLGLERVIREDLYHGQPCPTDPPSHVYSWLYPVFGWE